MTICRTGWDSLTLHVTRLKLKLVTAAKPGLLSPGSNASALSTVSFVESHFFHFNIIYVAGDGVLFITSNELL